MLTKLRFYVLNIRCFVLYLKRLPNSVCFTGAKNTDRLSTLTMVFILVGVVTGVFACFAIVAVSYRYYDHISHPREEAQDD